MRANVNANFYTYTRELKGISLGERGAGNTLIKTRAGICIPLQHPTRNTHTLHCLLEQPIYTVAGSRVQRAAVLHGGS